MFDHSRYFWIISITTYELQNVYAQIGFRYRSLSSVGPVFNITENVVSSFRRVVYTADSAYAF